MRRLELVKSFKKQFQILRTENEHFCDCEGVKLNIGDKLSSYQGWNFICTELNPYLGLGLRKQYGKYVRFYKKSIIGIYRLKRDRT